jgi:hypothetical protein
MRPNRELAFQKGGDKEIDAYRTNSIFWSGVIEKPKLSEGVLKFDKIQWRGSLATPRLPKLSRVLLSQWSHD